MLLFLQKFASNLSLRSSDAMSPSRLLHAFCDSENVASLSVILYSLILQSVKKYIFDLSTSKIKSLPKIYKSKAVFYDYFDLKFFILTTV